METTALQDAAAALREAMVRKEAANARCVDLQSQLDAAELEARESVIAWRTAQERLIRIASDRQIGE